MSTGSGEQRHEPQDTAAGRRVGCKRLILIEASPSTYHNGRLALGADTAGSLDESLYPTASV
jgi:hypothetical protein